MKEFIASSESLRRLPPFTLEAVLATSFDYRELANRLSFSGGKVPQRTVGMLPVSEVGGVTSAPAGGRLDG